MWSSNRLLFQVRFDAVRHPPRFSRARRTMSTSVTGASEIVFALVMT
jgi:hypothetical protein